MGIFSVAGFIVVSTFWLSRSSADDPEFPLFSGDISASGYIMVQDKQVETFKSWFSDTLKASKGDVRSFGIRRKYFVLERVGRYGSEVFIQSANGKRQCSFENGTVEKPVVYKNFFSFSSFNNKKYLGTEMEDGVQLQKWKYEVERGDPVIYIRQDVNGPVPVRIVGEDTTIHIKSFSSSPLPASTFDYNGRKCVKKLGLP